MVPNYPIEHQYVCVCVCVFQQCSVDGAGWCVCVRSSCGHRVSRSELDLRLQEVRVQLEQAVDLLETDRPDQSVRLLQRAVSQAGVFLKETHSLQGQLADAMARAYSTMGEEDSGVCVCVCARARACMSLCFSVCVYLRSRHSCSDCVLCVGEWQGAASQLERSVVAISSQYGEDSIELGRQLFKLAQLHFNG
uniref:Uncharacterized protein n=1 Tax=Hucho hucho TaxID=62062 RepID=A0A4W5M9Y8_9TELE